MKRIVFATILLVEDSTVTRKTIMEGLKNFNLGFLQSTTGAEALVMAQNVFPDVILLDLNLPDMNGYDILQEIRKTPSTAKIPVIIITQSNLTQDVQRCLKGGAQYYLIKPIDMGKLLGHICKLLDINESELTEEALHKEKIMADYKKKLQFGEPGSENKTSSSLNKIDIGAATPGMVVVIPVVLPGGTTILPPETRLTKDNIQTLIENDVKYIYIKPQN